MSMRVRFPPRARARAPLLKHVARNVEVVKLVDTHGSDPCALAREGSTPSLDTKRPRGGNGRHAGFKSRCLRASRFDSERGHPLTRAHNGMYKDRSMETLFPTLQQMKP